MKIVSKIKYEMNKKIKRKFLCNIFFFFVNSCSKQKIIGKLGFVWFENFRGEGRDNF